MLLINAGADEKPKYHTSYHSEANIDMQRGGYSHAKAHAQRHSLGAILLPLTLFRLAPLAKNTASNSPIAIHGNAAPINSVTNALIS
jgi:hypothetical protein